MTASAGGRAIALLRNSASATNDRETVMSEMIERVARAMHEAWGSAASEIYPGQWIQHPKWEDVKDKRMALIKARAAIEAMREPTEAMIDQFEWHKPQEAARFYWGHMIEEALK
jgi:hypothetical protein